ncbi:MAG: hypothetical protein JO040_14990 [Gemmatimonadetes bacterium]|nr:hypothetical protein [Gemmatimonadota bacterium]
MEDQEIAEQIQRRGLEIEYLRELAAALGFGIDEGWSEAVFIAIEGATMEERRRAAMRTLELRPEE